ncbi:unnamed protein product [Psylliodes chrysocephalus]|uniref:CCHC-type domain-containing protein n=1 Tax=Psylliodes chrysocephalus TaxID=3402493 RepID=A0A9P0GIF8_9CUCU|nr:unnamed protein product [Psylliodes chrysocephala]
MVINKLEKEKVDFHTFTRREDKIKKIVLKAAPGLDLEDLKEELEFEGVEVVSIINLRSRSENVESHSYQLCVKKETNLRDVYKIRHVQNTRVKWETYAKKNKITQCYRCQQFGHSQANCHKQPNCVKCAGKHLTPNCRLPRNIKNDVKCINCCGNHTANFSQCPVYLEHLEKSDEMKNKNTKKPHKAVNKIISSEKPYSQVTAGPRQENHQNRPVYEGKSQEMNEMAQIAQELREINKICNLGKIIHLLKEMKKELMQATSFADHAQIIMKYEELYQK